MKHQLIDTTMFVISLVMAVLVVIVSMYQTHLAPDRCTPRAASFAGPAVVCDDCPRPVLECVLQVNATMNAAVQLFGVPE